MSSFVITRFPVPNSIFLAVQRELTTLGTKQRQFVLHVLVSNLLNLTKIRHGALDGWLDVAIELPCQWIEEHFGRSFRATQIDPAILTMGNYSTAKQQCRSFKVSDRLLDLILGGCPASAASAADGPIVNLFDGTPYRVRAPAEWEDGVYSSKIVRPAINAIESCPFNAGALDGHLAAFRLRALAAGSDRERLHLDLALRNDRACAMRIRAGSRSDAKGLASYQPEYRTSYTGRVIEVGGGAQSCSRAMKAAMFGGIPDLQNYDLKRAQAFVLLQDLEDQDLPREWLERYLSEADANDTRAAALGISKDAFKNCLYATIMGATHAKLFDVRKNDVFAALMAETGGDRDRAENLTLNVYDALAPLKCEVKAWQEHLIKGDDCRHVDPIYKSVRTLKNACLQHFRLEGERADVLARQAAAFILQGQEAAFIHHLTVLGAAHGFVPVSNQHDGLIVLGDIPQSAIDQAAKSSGLRYATMETKPFV